MTGTAPVSPLPAPFATRARDPGPPAGLPPWFLRSQMPQPPTPPAPPPPLPPGPDEDAPPFEEPPSPVPVPPSDAPPPMHV